ncbi:myb-like protein Q [Macrobrachium nipponense]|uniref:myb-like protein Q n=1 Tax=Macrobrachium nipponense TaxID=159736 RepID=UPI0030C7E064
MPVAQYNTYLSPGAPHPTYRSYDADRGMGPPAVTLSSGVPLPARPQGPPPPPQPRPIASPMNSAAVSVPTFTLPPSGIPYTGPFPVHQNVVPSPGSYHGLHTQGPAAQSSTPLPSSRQQGSRAPVESHTPSGCPVGYPAGMGYPSSHPPQHQLSPPQVMDPREHYMGSRSHSYPGQQQQQYPQLFRAPPEESSRYHHAHQHLQQQQQPQYHQQQHHHPNQSHHHQQQQQHLRSVAERPLPSSGDLHTIFEEGSEGHGGKYGIGGGGHSNSYLQISTSEVGPYHSAGQTGLTSLTSTASAAEVQDRHAPPQPPSAAASAAPSQILQQPKTEPPEWWYDTDVLDRLEQIRLHSDSNPPATSTTSRDRTTTRRRRR